MKTHHTERGHLALAGLIQAKYRALHRLYAGLVAMVVISMGILAAGLYLVL